jgi:uncharacterized protein involved in exopolysaccharide biosynthesis
VTLSPEAQEEQQRKRLMVTAVDTFLGKLRVDNTDWNKVMKITFSSLDPKMAARVANEVPEAYMVGQLEARFEATEKANAWLMEQLQELEQKVVESERAVEIYREQHGMTGADGRGILDTQLSELNSQLIIARAERAEIEARLDQLRRLVGGGGPGVETASEVLSSAAQTSAHAAGAVRDRRDPRPHPGGGEAHPGGPGKRSGICAHARGQPRIQPARGRRRNQ